LIDRVNSMDATLKNFYARITEVENKINCVELEIKTIKEEKYSNIR